MKLITFTALLLVCFSVYSQKLDTVCNVKYELDKTFDYPNNLICRLSIQRRSFKTVWFARVPAASTGFFIRPNVILTNGHNVASNMWSSVESISIYPGYNKGESAQEAYTIEGKKKVKKVIVVPKKYGLAKRKSKKYPYDYALIFLEDYESPNSDFLELKVVDELIDEEVFTLGYPAAMFSDSSNHSSRTGGVNTIGEVQYYTDGHLKREKNKKSKRQIFFETCTKGGNSGSPVMVMRDDKIKVIGVHNAAHTGVRVTNEVISFINSWVELFESGAHPKRDHFSLD